MIKRILALFLVLCLVFMAAPITIGAASGQQVRANAVTVTAGNTVSVTLQAENFDSVAALNVYIYYNPEVLSVSSTYNGRMLSGAQASVNTGVAGEIKLSLMALNGISGTGNLMTVYFYTNSDCTPGTYPIEVAIGEAYDTGLQPTVISGVNGSVTVNKPAETQTFYLYNYLDKSTLQKGDTLSYQVVNSNGYSFVSGDFTVEYDHELFAFDSVELDSGLLGEGAIYSVNSSVLGQVRVVYANVNPVSEFYLLTVKLKVIADVDARTTVKAKASNVRRPDLSLYLPGDTSSTLTLEKMPVVADYPNAYFQMEELVVGEQSKSLFCLEGGAGVAAADFILHYDPTVLHCVNVTMADRVGDLGGMVEINPNYKNGTIQFSYINMTPYVAADFPLLEITWEPICSPQGHYEIVPSARNGVVDESYNPIVLEYVSASGCIYVPTVVPPACLEDGYTQFTCACGKYYRSDIVPHTGHTAAVTPGRNPTCTETGLTQGEHCSVCGEVLTAQNTIPSAGHSYLYQLAVEPGVSSEGSLEGTCSDCSDTTTVVLPILNTSDYRFEEQVAPTCTLGGVGSYTWITDTFGTYQFAVDLEPVGHIDADQDSKCDRCHLSLSLGDLNLDSKVNSDDLTLLARHVARIELLEDTALANADVNRDGLINSDDLTKHARFVARIITDWDQD